MKTKVMEKLANQDAERWAAAEMFYGEGAGTRRKLLDAELQSKFSDTPGYYEAFLNAYNSLDMNKFAEKAIKERKAIDRAAKASQNFRAMKNGNMRGLTNGLFLLAGAAYLAHATGYDKKIEVEARKAWKQAKAQYNAWRRREGYPKATHHIDLED